MLRTVFLLCFCTICYAQLLGSIADRLLNRRQNNDVSQHPNWSLLNSKKCGMELEIRIIGGMRAELGELPWIARIGYLGPKLTEVSYRCGGAVINNSTILTAAHCVTGLPKDFKVAAVQVGEYNTKTDPDCTENPTICAPPVQTLKPRQVIIHSEYNVQPFKNDIALIRVDNMKVDEVWVNPICVTNGALLTKNFVGTELKVGGWGIYNISDPKNSDDLMVVKLGVQNNEVCQKEYAKHAPIGPTQMCVGGTVGKDSCGGDSGGPLMETSNHEGPVRKYIVGIVSFGSKKCGETEMPGIYTRLSSYIDWLLDNIKENHVNYKIVQ